jgi:hypothetical protein
MKDNYRLVLYLFIILIILTGLALFVFQGDLLDYAQTQSGLTVALSPVTAPVAAGDSLDTSILRQANFTALTNHVVNFNFDNICWRPDTVSQAVAPATMATNTETGTAATSTSSASSPVVCVQGNSLPFTVKTK